MNKIADFPDDMGSGNSLRILKEDDGDIIIQIVKTGQKLSNSPTVQFCTSGTVNPGLALMFHKIVECNRHDKESEG